MGTYGIYEQYSPEALQRECFKPWKEEDGTEHTYTDIHITNFGHNVWYVGRLNGEPNYIGLNLVRQYAHEWTYKPLSEDMGPAEDDCPLALLALVPEPDMGYAKEWRERVRAYHAARAKRSKVERSMVAGTRVRLVGNLWPESYSNAEGTVIGKGRRGKLLINIDGLRASVPKRLIAEVLPAVEVEEANA